MSNKISLAPGFSPVNRKMVGNKNRLNGFGDAGKPLKRLWQLAAFHTRLKPGANENSR